MTAAPPPRGPVTDAVVDLLAATCDVWVGDGTGDPSSDPGVTATGAAPPYLVVEEVAGSASYGTVMSPDDMTVVVYQLTGVGATRRAARNVCDRAVTALLARSPAGGFVHALGSGDEVAVTDRRMDVDGGIDQEPGVFNAMARVALTLCAL